MTSESALGVIVTARCMNIAVVDEVTTDHHFHLYHIELYLLFISQKLYLYHKIAIAEINQGL